MCEAPFWRFNPCLIHFTSTYTYRVTIAPRMCSGGIVIVVNMYFIDKCTLFFLFFYFLVFRLWLNREMRMRCIPTFAK